MAWLLKLLLAVLAVLVFLLAALAVNQQEITVQFLRWQTPTIGRRPPLAWRDFVSC